MMYLFVAVLMAATLNPSEPPAQHSFTCAFADGKGVRVQYTPAPHPVKEGNAWTPGGKPVALFVDTSISVGGSVLPVGAYGLYFVSGKEDWRMIVSKKRKRPKSTTAKTIPFEFPWVQAVWGKRSTVPKLRSFKSGRHSAI
jgi:hypothetical protein